jgi:hypothetical protein
MTDRLSLSIFTIEVDGKLTLAFEAKRYSEAEASPPWPTNFTDGFPLIRLVL